MRHFEQGAPHEAAKWSSVPIINAGDGWGEHPTQVLTDLYTVYKEKGTLDGLNFMCVGDMRMRTMHSIGYALSQAVGRSFQDFFDDYFDYHGGSIANKDRQFHDSPLFAGRVTVKQVAIAGIGCAAIAAAIGQCSSTVCR